MTILAILQNQWFKDPVGVQEIFDRHPDKRERLIATYLFMGCTTGRRLQEAFGENLCDEIIWEEASPKIGGFSSAAFQPDLKHIRELIVGKHHPTILLSFGVSSFQGVWRALGLNIEMPPAWRLNGEMEVKITKESTGEVFPMNWIMGPHPAARDNPVPRLREMADRVRVLIQEQNTDGT